MSTLIATMTSLPYKQFRQNRYFYLWYDGTYAVLILAAIALMLATGWTGLVTEWTWWMLLAFPILLYTQIVGHVFVHNATHKAWPRPINRLVGELCGVWVLTRFASWEVVHQRHHQYSDDPAKDPHPVIANFWKFTLNTIVNVESQLQQAYYDTFGDTAENRRYEKLRALVSFAVGMMLLFAWFLFWGPIGFFALFLPAALLGGLHVIHFNWSTHNGFSRDLDFRPVNLDYGVYWWGNRIFFGIYYHANHHRRPSLFNPQFMNPGLPLEPAPTKR